MTKPLFESKEEMMTVLTEFVEILPKDPYSFFTIPISLFSCPFFLPSLCAYVQAYAHKCKHRWVRSPKKNNLRYLKVLFIFLSFKFFIFYLRQVLSV